MTEMGLAACCLQCWVKSKIISSWTNPPKDRFTFTPHLTTHHHRLFAEVVWYPFWNQVCSYHTHFWVVTRPLKKISWPVNVVEVLRNESKRTRLLFSIVSLPHLDQIFLLQKNLLYNKDPFPDRELILWKKSPNLQFSAREVRNHPSSSTACLCQFASP